MNDSQRWKRLFERATPLSRQGPGSETVPRPGVRGKFLYLGDDKLYVRGVTYGTFRPNGNGVDYPEPAAVERDFALMAASGINSIRTYKPPPRWLLDAAERHGLFVMVGLAWEQHVAFLDGRERPKSIEERVRADVRSCAGHPAVLCYAIGNEIPAPVVRWHGRRRVERFLERLYDAAKDEDPAALVTYVNYPSTEYLELRCGDIACFNVYLEERERLESYLARLHNLAGDRPLLMAEIGLDSRRHGERTQADVLRWQLEATFASGCAGAFVFAWTDEWYVTFLDESGRGNGGMEVEDWDFGITDRIRHPKPALAAVRDAFRQLPLPRSHELPRVSAVVCTHNGARTLADCLEGLEKLQYPDYEVIVVDDGSTDATPSIAERFRCRLISTEHSGLASARNTGLAAATGEIVAYIDDDARPDRDWLTFLANAFLNSSHAGIGGPNVEHPANGRVAECVARAPGGPVHVLLSDTEAEHLPGCNMAFRRDALEAVGGFDRQFWIAGDDVDLCWRVRDQGWTLGFSPGAVVWHRQRQSISAYWRQQVGYGRAEAMLERKWPERYNGSGHLTWAGRLYGGGAALPRLGLRRPRIYHGTWGSSLFQSVYRPASGLVAALPSMPEWYFALGFLAVIATFGFIWSSVLLLLVLPLLALGLSLSITASVLAARRATSTASHRRGRRRLQFVSVAALLYAIQPAARLWGRVRHGLTPWRRRGTARAAIPWPCTKTVWSARWRAPEKWLGGVEQALRSGGASVIRGGDYDSWDLEIRGGALASARLRVLVEEHGRGQQLVRLRSSPKWGPLALAAPALLALAAAAPALAGNWNLWVPLVVAAIALTVRGVQESAAAMGEVARATNGPSADVAAPARPLKEPTAIRP